MGRSAKEKAANRRVEDALCFNFLFDNPVLFRDVFMPQFWGKYYKTRYYQYSEALSKNAVVLGGRSFGKCLAGSTMILSCVDGVYNTIKDLYNKKEQCLVSSLGKDGKVITEKAKVFSTGFKKVYKLRLRGAKEIKASADHRFLTGAGWKRLHELKKRELVATLKHVSDYKEGLLPNEFLNKLKYEIKRKGFAYRRLGRLYYTGIDNPKDRDKRFRYRGGRISKEIFRKYAEIINSEELIIMANSDIHWEQVKKIEYIGIEETYDLEVENTHNFIANDIIVHNSVGLELAWTQIIITRFNEESLLTTFRKLHIKDRAEKVISNIQLNPYLKYFLRGSSNTTRDSITRTPTYEIRLRNGHVAYGISTGDDPLAIMIQGKHPHWRFGDEMQSYVHHAWIKFQGAQDPRGSHDKFYGCIDGRIGTPFRKLDGKIKKFYDCRYRISRRLEPYFNQQTKLDCAQIYGGLNADEFKMQVDAEYAEPLWSVWPEKAIVDCIDTTPVEHNRALLKNEMQIISISGKEYSGLLPEQVLYDLPSLPEEGLEMIMGIDTGYTQPTVILPFYYYKEKWNLVCRIVLRDKVIPDDQAEIMDYIADFYKGSILAIDCSSAEGKAPATALLNPKRSEFVGKHYEDRVIMVEFQKRMTVGYRVEGEELVEITERIKEKTTEIGCNMFVQNKIRIYKDEDFLKEFNDEKRKKVGESTLIFTPMDCHIPEAYRCFCYAWSLKHQGIDLPETEEEDIDYEFAVPEYHKMPFQILGRRAASPGDFIR